MRSVGIKLLKNKLSEFVRLANAGERILVTDRDRVVAELGPPPRLSSGTDDEALLARGAREGWLTRAERPRAGPPPRCPVMSFEELMTGLAQDREDR